MELFTNHILNVVALGINCILCFKYCTEIKEIITVIILQRLSSKCCFVKFQVKLDNCDGRSKSAASNLNA